MPSAAFVIIKEGKHIDDYLELILIQINIVWRYWVRQSVKMVALKHFFFVKSRSKAIAIPFWEIDSFNKVKERVAKASLFIVLNVYYCFLFR